MTTQDYELLDQSPRELEQVIRQYPDIVKSLDDDVLQAMLGWGQAGQDATVYDPCFDEIHRRDSEGYEPVRDRVARIRGTEAALKSRMATALEFEHIVEGFDR